MFSLAISGNPWKSLAACLLFDKRMDAREIQLFRDLPSRLAPDDKRILSFSRATGNS